VFRDESEYVRIRRGVPQGMASSPVLFSFYLERIFRKADVRCHYQAFADDIILYSEDLEELKMNFKRLNDAMKHYELKINFDKSELLTNDGRC
jgi:hypothetical protein